MTDTREGDTSRGGIQGEDPRGVEGAGWGRRTRSWWPALVFAATAVIMLRRLLFVPGLLGLRHDWPIPLYPSQLLQWLVEHFYIWSVRFQGNRQNLFGLPWTTVILISPAALGMDGAVASRLLLLGSIGVSGFSLWFLARTLEIPPRWALVAGFLYTATPVLFEKIISGYIHYMVSYALQPAALALFIRSVGQVSTGRRGHRNLILSGLATAMTWYQPQFILMLPFELLLWCASRYRTVLFWPYLRSLAIVLLLALGINATLLVSGALFALDAFDTTVTPVGQTLGYWTIYASRGTNFASALVMVDATFSYFSNSVWQNPLFPLWFAATVFLFTFIYAGAILRLRQGPDRRVILYFLGLCLVSAFVGKGLGEPLGGVTFFLFVNLPPLQAFREFGHIMGMGALGTACLLGLSLQTLHWAWMTSGIRRRLLSHSRLKFLGGRGGRGRLPEGIVVAGVAIALVGIYGWPMFTGDLAGNVQAFAPAPDVADLYDRLAHDPGDYRVLWIPNVQPVTYPGVRYAGNDPIQLYSPKSTLHPGFPANAALGPFIQFLGATLHENRTEYLGDLLAMASTRYILYREGPRTAFQNFSAMGLLDRAAYDRYANESLHIPPLLEAQRDLSRDSAFNLSTVTVWRNQQETPRAYVADRVFLVAGDLTTLVSLAYARELPEADGYLGSHPAFLFLSQLPAGTDLRALMARVDGVIVDRGHLEDLALALVPAENKLIFDHLEDYGDLTQPAPDRWTRVQSFWFWRDWHYVASLDDPVMAIQSSPLYLPVPADRPGPWEGYIKGFVGPRSSPLDIRVGERFQQEINLTAPGVETRWLGLGEIPFDAGNMSLWVASRAQLNENHLQDGSFEEGWDASAGAPVGWVLRRGNVTLDSSISWDGDFSARLSTAPGRPSSAIVGSPVPVLGGARYRIGTWLKTINGQGVELTVEGFDSLQGNWTTLASLGPNATYKTAGQERELYLNLPDRINYLRPILLAGTPRNVTRGEAVAWFDKVTFTPDVSDSALARVALLRPGALQLAMGELATLLSNMPFLYLSDLGSQKVGVQASGGELTTLGANATVTVAARGLPQGQLRLLVRSGVSASGLQADSGENRSALITDPSDPSWSVGALGIPGEGAGLSITNAGTSVVPVDLVLAYSPGRMPTRGPSTLEDPRRQNPTRYSLVVHGNASKFLVFNDAYDRWWRAGIGGRSLEPVMVNSGMMGFWLDPSDEGNLVLEFLPQKAYYVGIAIGVISLSVAVALVALSHPRLNRWWIGAGRALVGLLYHGLKHRER